MIGIRQATPVVRVFALATVFASVGRGMFITVSAIYFVRVVGLSPTQVGVGLTVAGLAGLAIGVPIGHLCDLRGPRGVLLTMLVVSAFATTGYALVGTFGWFVVIACAVSAAGRGTSAARGATLAQLGSDTRQRAEIRAQIRAVHNIGVAVGSGLGALTLAVDTAPVYRAAILLDAASFLMAAALALRLPRLEPVRERNERGAGMLAVFRDPPYVVVVLLSTMLNMQFAILDVALPLWVVTATDAPRWIVPVTVVLNTLAVALWQVPVTRRYTGLNEAARALRWAGLVLLLACVLLALAGSLPTGWAVAALLIGALVHVAGELLQSAGTFTVSFDLAPEGMHGRYQGLMATGTGVSTMLAPMVLVLLCVEWGLPGWVLIGVLFAACGAAYTPVTRWATRRAGHSPDHTSVNS